MERDFETSWSNDQSSNNTDGLKKTLPCSTDDLAMEHLKKIAGFVQGHVQTFNHTALHRGVDQDGEEFNNLEELESLDEDYTSVGRG